MLDAERLLNPIAADAPVGVNIRTDPAAKGLDYQLKDARSAARLAERQADAEAERTAVASEWRTVDELAQTILAKTSKDIEVAAWLVEASVRLDGFAGLRQSAALLDGLVERYWPDLPALDPDDPSSKVAPVAGLNGVGAEGSLIQPIRLAPISDPADGAPVSLWDYIQMRKRGPASPQAAAVASAIRATSAKTLLAIFGDISQALNHFSRLSARLDALCGDDTPPSSAIRNVLGEALDALRDVARDTLALAAGTDEAPELAPAPLPAPLPAPPPPPAAKEAGPAPLRTREDALRELSRIAAFFQDTEPNSPTAYTLQTLIRRARLPLLDLLAELIPEETSRRTFLDMAGIKTPGLSP